MTPNVKILCSYIAIKDPNVDGAPSTLGSLIAMYEHKIFTLGVIWNILSFDQFGVELGKKLATNILQDLASHDFSGHDSSTKNLLNRYSSTD